MLDNIRQDILMRCTFDFSLGLPLIISEMMSIGTGNTIVELFSWEMLLRVWR